MSNAISETDNPIHSASNSMPLESMHRFRNGTTFVHMNVCSLLPKLEELRIFFKNINIQVLSINESWLCEDING